MIQIAEKEFLAMNIASLDKSYKKAKLKGVLASEDIYLLNAIYKLLNYIDLTSYDVLKRLYFLYNHILDTSKETCRPRIEPQCLLMKNTKPTFLQKEAGDCDGYIKFENIYYWQELEYSIDFDQITNDIVNPGYLTSKRYDTEANFAIGKNIDYTSIGLISFLVLDASNTDTYKIYDVLNNDVTHTFQRLYIEQMKGVVFTSTNRYSHSTMFIKIKKIN